jgi:nucleotide-binding universal stress UspA family protein
MTGNADHPGRAEPGDIVVGIDDSPSSVAALAWAATWARSMGAQLRAVHVVDPAANASLVWATGFPAMAYVPAIPNREDIEQDVSAVFRAVGPEPDWTLEFRDGPTGRELVSAAAEARLLVVGTREHVGLGRLISGSVSHFCLTHATCPVVAVPPSLRHDEPEAVATGHDLAWTATTGSAR